MKSTACSLSKYEHKLLDNLRLSPPGHWAVIGTLDDDDILRALHQRRPDLIERRVTRLHGEMWRLRMA